jgi:hypothetical protein
VPAPLRRCGARHTANVTTRGDLADPVVPTAPSVVPPEAPAGGQALPSFGIVVVAALRLFDAVGLIFITLGLGQLPLTGFPILGDEGVTYWLNLFYAGLIITGVIGLLARQGWGWVLTMVLVGVGLVGELIRVAIGIPDYLGLLLLVISAFYLNQRSVRAMAGRHLRERDEATT